MGHIRKNRVIVFDARVGAGVLDIDRMFEAALNYIDGANDNDYEGDIITKKIYVTAGEELQVGFAWLITAEEVRNSHADLHITDYDVKIYDYLYADQPIASSTSTNSNVEVVRYTPQYDGQVWVVVTQNDPIDWSYIEYDYYALTYAGGMETPYG